MRYPTLKHCALVAMLLLLAACASQKQKRVVYRPAESEVQQQEEIDSTEMENAFRRTRLLADMLYEAKLAFEDNRLMSPSGNNAYERYREILQLDPGNTVALEGIEDIVRRYIELSDMAVRQGKYDEGQNLLDRAESLNPARPELADARKRLAVARLNKVETFELDAAGLKNQSLEVMIKLAEIAQFIQSKEASFMINARSDEEGRWIYKVMRESVGSYRLRGNIDVSSQPSIRVNIQTP